MDSSDLLLYNVHVLYLAFNTSTVKDNGEIVVLFHHRSPQSYQYSRFTGNEPVCGFAVHATIMVGIPNVLFVVSIMFLCSLF